MKIELKYVNREPRGGRSYYYFRRRGVRIALPGVPGTREFQEAYDDAISQHAPELRKKVRGNGARGTIDWAIIAYFLMRYTGQRRGDCCDMKWSDFNQATREMFVVQEKTGTKVWVPAPQRLLDHLRTLEHDGDYILMSPKGDRYASTSITNLICGITAELGFATTDSKGRRRGYSPHGLRHLCGAELTEAGCSTDLVMSILGHKTEKQARRYQEQANKRRMAHEGNRRREEMYARQERNDAIDATYNVRRIKVGD
jgi:integrase